MQPLSLGRVPGPLRLVALGDSVASGTGCGCDPFPDLVAQELGWRTSRGASTTNLAVGGADSTDALDDLNDPTVQRRLAAADVVVVELGANDFDEGSADDPACSHPQTDDCFADNLRTMTTNLRRLVAAIHALPRPPDARIVLIAYWNVFHDGEVGRARGETYVANSARLTDAVNAAILDVARQNGELYADALAPFKGNGSLDATFALSPDGNHPNARGHRLLADAVVAALAAAGAVSS